MVARCSPSRSIWAAAPSILKPGDAGLRLGTWIAVEQVLAGGQAAIGVLLLVLGYRPDTSLHYVYGFGPLVILAIAHGLSREVAGVDQRRAMDRTVGVFGAASFICFGFSLRALMTGLGIG